MKKKILSLLMVLTLGYGIWTQIYSYDVDDAVEHVEKNALSRSHTCCAWFVMRGMQSGGCPIGILPAWAYRYALPCYGFTRVASGKGNDLAAYTPQKGDIVVIERGKHSFWGHIAMFTGKNGSQTSNRRQCVLIVSHHLNTESIDTNKLCYTFYTSSISLQQ